MDFSFDNRQSINSSKLKIMAMIFMFIDHFGGFVIEEYMLVTSNLPLYTVLQNIAEVCRSIGRLAFPIFCYQLVVGFRYTHSKQKHLIELLFFTLISEIPFDLALTGHAFYNDYQSVYLTLLLGGLAIVLMDYVKEIQYHYVFQIMIAIVFCILAYLLKTDYGMPGVVLIVAFYFFLDYKPLMVYAVPAIFIASYFTNRLIKGFTLQKAWSTTLVEAISVFAMFLIVRDNGIRKGGKALKWFGYAFYPLHLFLFFLIRKFIFKI